MVYIASVSPIDDPDSEQIEIFDTYLGATILIRDFESCHGGELIYRIYEADNEFTAKRRLLLEE